jgi:hypothetical protein
LIDSANLKYQFHQSNSEAVIEVRDNGVPVGYVANVISSTFTLNASPFGQITCSVQGDKTAIWNKTCANVITRLTTSFGHSSSRFTLSDIDSSNFNAFNVGNPSPIGLNINQSDTVLNACAEVAQSIGAQITMSKTGLLQLNKIDLSGTPVFTITDKDIIKNSLSLVQKIPVQGSFRVGYCKNYTVQPQLDTRIPAKHKAIFAKEYLEVKAEDSTVKSNYKQLVEVERVDTLLLTETDAQNLANSLLSLWSIPRFIFQMQVIPRFLNAKLGDIVTLQSSRFNLSSGKQSQIIGIQVNYGNGNVQLKVLV